jgi:hypothetical protein
MLDATRLCQMPYIMLSTFMFNRHAWQRGKAFSGCELADCPTHTVVEVGIIINVFRNNKFTSNT